MIEGRYHGSGFLKLHNIDCTNLCDILYNRTIIILIAIVLQRNTNIV